MTNCPEIKEGYKASKGKIRRKESLATIDDDNWLNKGYNDNLDLVCQEVPHVNTGGEISLKAVKIGGVKYPAFTTLMVISNPSTLCHLTNSTKGMMDVEVINNKNFGIGSN